MHREERMQDWNVLSLFAQLLSVVSVVQAYSHLQFSDKWRFLHLCVFCLALFNFFFHLKPEYPNCIRFSSKLFGKKNPLGKMWSNAYTKRKTDNFKQKEPTLNSSPEHFLFFQSIWALVPEPAWGLSNSPGTPAPMVPTLILNLFAIFTHSLTDQIFKCIFNNISSIKHTVHFLTYLPFPPPNTFCITFCSISNSSGLIYTWVSGIQTQIVLLMKQVLFLTSVLKKLKDIVVFLSLWQLWIKM